MDTKTKKRHKKEAETFRKTKITGDFPETAFNREFGTVDKCVAMLEKIRWNGKPYSPFTKSYRVKRITIPPEKIKWEYQKYQWLDRTCNRHFSVLTGTPFARSKVPLTKWFKMVWYICVTSNSISSYMYAALLDVSQTTAWFMHQRIMACLEQDGDAIFEGIVDTQRIYSDCPKLKESLHDTYMSVTKHHLKRYLNEYIFFNLTRPLPHRLRFQVALQLMDRSVKWKDIVMPGRETYDPKEKLSGMKRGRAKEFNVKQEPAKP